MRVTALLLLLANVAFLAWALYAPEPGNVEPQLIAQQLKPDAIHLLSDQQVAAMEVKKPEEPAKADEPAKAEEPAKPAVCLEWGAFPSADVAKAREALTSVVSGVRITERQAEEATGWWVVIPPLANRQAALQKVAELKRLGIDEYFIVQDDTRFRFAISLGIFRTEEAAQKRLEQLQGRGVRAARVGPRIAGVTRVSLQLRNLLEASQPKVNELLKEFPGTTMKRPAITHNVLAFGVLLAAGFSLPTDATPFNFVLDSYGSGNAGGDVVVTIDDAANEIGRAHV